MENSSEVLHTMERLVSSLLQSNRGPSEVTTIDIGVTCHYTDEKGNAIDALYPDWEGSKPGDLKARQVTFTGSKVSVVFKGKETNGILYNSKEKDVVFGTFLYSADVEKFKSGGPWKLTEIHMWGNRPYRLKYECQGATHIFSETARDEEWARQEADAAISWSLLPKGQR